VPGPADAAGTDHETPALAAGPGETLLAFLDYLREAVARKLDGLQEEEARRPLVPSGTSLLGLVKHLTVVESYWVERRFAGLETTPVTQAPDAGFALAPDDTVAGVLAAYRATVGRANALVAGRSLDTPLARGRRGQTLTWVLVHLVEETARHAGHADILRELVDGAAGR
jgi:hypothetical protein